MFSSFLHIDPNFIHHSHQMNVPTNDIFMRDIKIIRHPLINDPEKKIDHFNERIDKGTGAPIEIDHLVLHCSFEPDIENVLDRRGLSAHYVIHKDGTILQCVDESKRAYHAYPAFWDKVGGRENNMNAHSIGIEIENPTFGSTTTYSDAAINSLIPLCRSIIARHHIKPHNVIGHSDINPGGKADPGVLFPWRKLAEAGIGIFPRYTELPDDSMELPGASYEEKIRKALESIGYKTKTEVKKKDGYTEIIEIKDNLPMAWLSFMRHYMPFGVTGELPTPEQIREYRAKNPQKSTAEIMSDLSFNFMKEFETNTNLDPQKQVTRVSSLGLKRLQVVERAFRMSRAKMR